ncbi:hypothetical protein E1630_23665 [Salmonella enterica subsp. enterica serovar Baguida]|nr:hypothetical protein [Salmonella enterica subsp. enterica serovar Baguida]
MAYEYDRAGGLLEERTAHSRKTYIYGDAWSHMPVACAERRGGSERIYHYQSDPSLRIRTVMDEEGKTVWDGCWKAWGRMEADVSGAGEFEQNLRLAGQYYDRESGLHYNLFRYYDPDVPGRFLSSDPIGLRGGINLYRYAPNALGWIDPLGLATGASIFAGQDAWPCGYKQHERCCFPYGPFEALQHLLTIDQTQLRRYTPVCGNHERRCPV